MLRRVMMAGAGGGGVTPYWATTTYTTNGSTTTTSSRYGYTFTVSGSNLVGNTLRVNVPSAGADEQVIIHRNSDDAVIASATIPIPSGNTWHTGSVSEFTLVAGNSYTISIRRANGTSRSIRYNNTVSHVAQLTSLSGVLIANNNRPTTPTANVGWGCDFGYVAPP